MSLLNKIRAIFKSENAPEEPVDASTLITEDFFWDIIERSNKGRNLKEVLSQLSEAEIFGYQYWWEHFCALSYNQSLWAVAYTVLGGCSDDGFDYFRCWLISRGRKVFYAALENADSLCGEFDNLSDEEYPQQEELSYIPAEVIRKKSGRDFEEESQKYDMAHPSLPEIEFEWNEEDESTIRAICPMTFDQWWNNDRF